MNRPGAPNVEPEEAAAVKQALSDYAQTVQAEIPSRELSRLKAILLWLLSFLPQTVIYRSPGEKYLTRYYLLGGPRSKGERANVVTTKHSWLPFNLFIHCFHSSDDPPSHNHPWTWARSLILWNSYRETRVLRMAHGEMLQRRVYKPGMINRIDQDTYHYVELLEGDVWTLFLVGRNVQGWGFLTDKGHVRARDWINRDKPATGGKEVVDDLD